MEIIEGRLDASGLHIAIVAARFNEAIVRELIEGALATLRQLGGDEKLITLVHVPGSFELPQVAARLAGTRKYNAIICLGAIIRGETPHFEHVSTQAASGVSRVGIESGVPTVFGVLTTDTIEQAVTRAGMKQGNQGRTAAMVAVEMANLYRTLS